MLEMDYLLLTLEEINKITIVGVTIDSNVISL